MKKFYFMFMLSLFASSASASIVWDWSFGSNAGQLITDGNTAAAGTYLITDFSVTASGAGATIGSWSGGQYAASGFSTNVPYSLVWNGSNVTQWLSGGGNSFDWLVFDDLLTSSYIFFGWETGNINTVNQAAYYPASQQSSLLSVSVASSTKVPEPSSVILFGLGLFGLGFMRKKKSA